MHNRLDNPLTFSNGVRIRRSLIRYCLGNVINLTDRFVQATIEKAQSIIRDDKHMSAGTKSIVEILILVITLLANRLNLNSTNSSKPPSSDPNRKKKPNPKTGRNKGGQKGHVGTTLKKVDDPDIIEPIQIDRRWVS